MKAKCLTVVLISGVLFGAACECYAWPLPEPPIAELECPNNAVVGDSVILDGSGSHDPDGGIITKYEWDFDYNDVVGFDCDYSETPPSADCNFDGKTTHIYSELGDYKVQLKVTDDEGQWSYSSALDIHVCRIVNITQDSNHPTIQDAIDDANNGNTIVVAEGTYTGSSNLNLDFYGKAITVRSIDPNDPAVVAATIIDCNGTSDEPNRGFYFHSSEDANSVLAGFTITNGYVTSNSPGGAYGGGIYCSNGSSPTITNCTISSNSAYGSGAKGGGIYCSNQSEPNITNCTFSSNSASGSGAHGGGIYCSNQSEPNITNCTITHNEADDNGGGIYCYDSDPNIINCTISSNSAAGQQAKGGGMHNDDSSPTVTSCLFSENSATYGSGMYNKSGSSPRVVNCVFSKNKKASSYGGGMYNYWSSPTVVNCTFSRNSAGTGGGIYNSISSPTITNCILWGNSDSGGTDESAQIHNASSTPVINYCCVQGWTWTLGGTGNIDSDPCFVNINWPAGPDGSLGTADDGLFLRTDSPCIDEGNNVAIEDENIDTDIIGNPRKIDGDHNDTVIVDMGAYELPPIWYVDANVQDGNDDGTSWTNAYDDLQDALTDPNIKDGNEIWVAEGKGTYKPDGNDPNNRSLSFELVEGVGVYGGFSGGETARIDRDWTLYETILSGDINTPDVNTDNSYHVVIGADRAVLDGFTITRGNASGSDANSDGGGVYCYETSPIISNCTIADNYSIGDGGGIYCYRASLQISDCVIVDNNSSGSGGGMYNDGGDDKEDIRFPTVTNCFFIGNNCGGMVNYYCCGWQMLITNCVFSGNENNGISNYDASSPTLVNCTFAKNVTGMTNGLSSPTVINCIFWANTGREISNRFSNPTFSYCDVNGCGGSDNWDSYFGTDGGGNIDTDPYFVDASNPAGPDGIFGTLDDGLRLLDKSPCIDAADGNAAPVTDILGYRRFDINDVNNTGTGDPNYADIGAYERPLKILVMCWTNESSPYNGTGGLDWFETDLGNYRSVINSVAIVKSGCRVPTNEDYPAPIEKVLPDEEGYEYDSNNPPEGIGIENCNRPPSDPTNLDELMNDFEDIRGDLMPDYLLLVVDNSFSMIPADVWPGWPSDTTNYDNFVNEVKTRCPGIVIGEMQTFGESDEDWVNEITKAIKSLLNEL